MVHKTKNDFKNYINTFTVDTTTRRILEIVPLGYVTKYRNEIEIIPILVYVTYFV